MLLLLSQEQVVSMCTSARLHPAKDFKENALSNGNNLKKLQIRVACVQY